jgi:hypothetical protein
VLGLLSTGTTLPLCVSSEFTLKLRVVVGMVDPQNKYNTGTIATEKLRTRQFPTTFFTSSDDG